MTPSTLQFLGVALLLYAVGLTVFLRFATAAVALILACPLSEQVTGQPLPAINLGLVQLTPLDLLASCALGAAIAQIGARRGRLNVGIVALGSLFLFVVGSVTVGSLLYGVPQAGNQARLSIQVISFALYAATAPNRRVMLRGMMRVWLAGSAVCAVLALLWWQRHGIGSTSEWITVNGVFRESRALGAPYALLLAQAAVGLLCFRRGRPGARYAAAALLAIVLLLQHRTGWAAAALMLGAWQLLRSGAAARIPRLVGWGLASTVVALMAMELGLLSSIGNSLSTSAADDRTFAWRVEGWQLLVARLHSIQDWLFGLPFGTPWDRQTGTGVVTVSAHSEYVQQLTRIGLVGMSCWLIVEIRALRRSTRQDDDGLLITLLALGQMAFAFTYPLFPEQGVILGLIAAYGTVQDAPERHHPAQHGVFSGNAPNMSV